MGYIKEKYTKEYFLGQDDDGQPVDYGALGAREWSDGGIFHEISDAIDLVNLSGKRVLEIGYGRGESARYMLETKEITYYLGIDFSPAAYELASKTVINQDKSRYELILADVYEHLLSQEYTEIFDVVFMLDVIEHIPRNELLALLPYVHRALTLKGSLVIDTPFYSVDEDYISQGEQFICPSPTDVHPKTSGMHCNKYSRTGLIAELGDYGFYVHSDKIFQKRRFKGLWKYVNRYRFGRRKV